jgi:hypothetical protein
MFPTPFAGGPWGQGSRSPHCASAQEPRPQAEDGPNHGHGLHVELTCHIENDSGGGAHKNGMPLLNIWLGHEGVRHRRHKVREPPAHPRGPFKRCRKSRAAQSALRRSLRIGTWRRTLPATIGPGAEVAVPGTPGWVTPWLLVVFVPSGSNLTPPYGLPLTAEVPPNLTLSRNPDARSVLIAAEVAFLGCQFKSSAYLAVTARCVDPGNLIVSAEAKL